MTSKRPSIVPEMVPRDSLSHVVLTPSLAPYKILLLAFIAAYCAGILPKKTHRPLLATIVKYIEGPEAYGEEQQRRGIPTLRGILHDITQACVAADAQDGEHNAKDIEARALHGLWTLKSLDSLNTFMTRAKSLVVKNMAAGNALISKVKSNERPAFLLTSASFLGKFVIRCTTVYESLEYDKANLLWSGFVNFRRESMPKVNKEEFAARYFPTDPNDDPSVLKSILQKMRNGETNLTKDVILVSQEDFSQLVHHQLQQLERHGTSTPPKLKQIFQNMAQVEAGKIPQVHYIRYLECVRKQDYEGAFNWLHRYFDYRISTREGSFYHYALLCLASLHAHFHNDGEAIRAIEEAIAVAREKKDLDCLSFLLTWLFNFMKDRPYLEHDFYVSNAQLIEFLKSHADVGTKSLHSMAYQSDAALLMMEGGPVSMTLESLTKSLYITLNGSDDSSTFGTYCALYSSFWFRQGNYHLADVYDEVISKLTTHKSEQVKVGIRKAHLLFYHGEMNKAFELLVNLKKNLPSDANLMKDLLTHEGILTVRLLLNTNELDEAQICLNRLQSQTHIGVDIEGTLSELECDLQVKLGNLVQAYEMVNERLRTFAKRGSTTFWFLRFNILKCHILSMSSSPARALSASIQCLNSTLSCGYSVLILQATVQVCSVLFKLSQFKDCEELLSASLQMFEGNLNVQLMGELYKLLGCSLMELHFTDDNLDREKNITKVIKCFELATDRFRSMGMLKDSCDCLELQLNFGRRIGNLDIVNHVEQALHKVKMTEKGADHLLMFGAQHS